MTDPGAKQLRWPDWTPKVALAGLVLASTATCLGNLFVQDDQPIIRDNALVHTLRLWHLFTQAYWPPGYPRELYRPFTSSLLALEWVTGGGRPVLFRIVSILLYIVATLAVYRLATRVLPKGAAWLAAAWFAVHPVHVEAVAVAVNQAELIVGALMALLVTQYIDDRRAGRPPTPGWIAGMTLAYFAAMMFKEHAVLLPLLFVAAEVTVIADARPWRERLTQLRPLYLVLALAAVSFVGIRSAALGGDTKGSFTAEALQNLAIGGRVRTMLGVVPEWTRLFFWPDHLRADYSPQEIVPATVWTGVQTLGLAILGASVVLAWLCRRRRPAVTFGILWTAVALTLVSNLVVPLGIVLAERTLFLATIGVVIAGADLLWAAGAYLYGKGSLGRISVVTATAVLLAMGASRSASRQLVWHDVVVLWHQTVIDAPNSYRAQQAYGAVLFSAGMERTGEEYYRHAMQLFPGAWPLYLDLADKLRMGGHCEPAIQNYRIVLTLTPSQAGPRASEIACLLYLGQYRQAALEARLGVGYGLQRSAFGVYAQIADSAERVHAPLHSVNIPPVTDSVKIPAP